MVETGKCLQRSLEVRDVGEGGQEMASLMDNLFSAEEREPAPGQIHSALLRGSACTYAIP